MNTPTTNSNATDYTLPSADRQQAYLFDEKTRGMPRVTLYLNGKEKLTDVLDIVKKQLNHPEKAALLVLGSQLVITDSQQYHHHIANGGRGSILAETAADLHRANWGPGGREAASYSLVLQDQ